MKDPAQNKKTNVGKTLLIGSLAWVVVLILGVTLCVASIYFSIAFAENNSLNKNAQAVVAGYTFSTSGLILLAPLLMLCEHLLKRRQSIFLAQINRGLGLGAIVYSLALAATIVLSLASTPTPSNESSCTSLEDQYRTALLSVVPITTDQKTGTAFAIQDGHTLLTAYHVVEGASEIYANWTSGRVNITLQEAAPEYDLALLKIDRPVEHFLSLTSHYKTTDPLYALGWPGNTFTAGQATVSSGIVSRILSNSDLKLNSQDAPDNLEIVQIDAAINPGNSGGPVINRCGAIGIAQSVSDSSSTYEYIGVVSEQGIGYAISSKTAAERFSLPITTQ